MPRYIDSLPEPAKKTPVKIVVATASRTGTLSVYEAMKILGYRPYHMAECVLEHGVSHMQVLDEALVAHYDRYSGIKRCTKEDFDKWFAGYDQCLVEVPYFMGPEILEAYADDPNVKFILTDRNPDKWVTSVNNTAGNIIKMGRSFPMNILQHFNTDIWWFLRLNRTLYGALADGTVPDDENNEEALRRNYVSYINMAKRTIPADRLCYFRLEDGLGWEQLCPFLEVPIPDQKFPDANVQENFKRILGDWMAPRVQSAMFKLGAVVVPVLGSLAYFGVKYNSLLWRST
ncbi:hypothetical protein QQS21_001271 [Conoideocrella luteorostrata]|uniref:P-loop containing nucleoside triphosphate hydrolase protein n=1 Tax=Conoideocrella luteorostrata TaxID=1105319 RepID=A0AAJ0CXC0_9HYPO|nr:hypothetical protein QQS21_001271 [Conoideocrella luteorostrata]